MSLPDYTHPNACPPERPPFAEMGARTRELHESIDAHARAVGLPYLHPTDPTLQLDLFGSAQVVAWQEAKAARHEEGTECWSELPHLYARYGTHTTHRLLAFVRELEGARAALVTDCGMQAVAMVLDTLMVRGAHAVTMRQVYNKTRAYLERLAERVSGSLTVVDDGDLTALAAAIRPETRLIFAETFTNPLVRAQDPVALARITREGRRTSPALRLVIDDTIATRWSLRHPLLATGADVVVSSGTKALGGQDRDMWGLIATNDVPLANRIMDLQAMRGGALDWRRAEAIVAGLPAARASFERRCETARAVAAFLSDHPRVEVTNHPSLPTHPDAEVVSTHYVRHGSLLSFRVVGADEAMTRHLADVLATCRVVRFALSFDGLTTKVNHHRSVSEYFSPEPLLVRNGLDRLIRLGVGLEDADDLIAALNWTLHHGRDVPPAEIARWQEERRSSLGLPRTPPD